MGERVTITEAQLAVLEGMTPKYRIPFVMHHQGHVPYRQIAEELGIPIGTVKSRILRGKTEFFQLWCGDK